MELTREQFIEGLEQRIKDLENHASEYWRGVRDGYISTLETINKFPPVVSGERPYFKLSRNEYGKAWLFYKPSEEAGRFNCWMPIDEEFYKAFEELLKASTASVSVERPVEGGTEGKELGVADKDKIFIDGDFNDSYESRVKRGKDKNG